MSLIILLIIIAVAAMILFFSGKIRQNENRCIIAFILMALVASGALFGHVGETQALERRIVYRDNTEMVLINDKSGETEKINLEKVAHTDRDYLIDDQIIVVTNKLGKPVFVSPANEIATDTPSEEPEKE